MYRHKAHKAISRSFALCRVLWQRGGAIRPHKPAHKAPAQAGAQVVRIRLSSRCHRNSVLAGMGKFGKGMTKSGKVWARNAPLLPNYTQTFDRRLCITSPELRADNVDNILNTNLMHNPRLFHMSVNEPILP